MKRLTVALIVVLAALLAMASGPVVRSAGPQQVSEPAESEPNDTCATAQDLGTLSGPLSLSGSIEGGPYPVPEGDRVDFFSLAATPGLELAIELRGAPSGQGTLADPLVGVFDDSCNLLVSRDDSPGSVEPALIFTVPAGGRLVIAATAFPDFGFTGAGYSGGSYTLRIEEARLIAGITGSLVDDTTGVAPSDWVQLELQRCEGGACSTAGYAGTYDGQFSFPASPELPLFAGSYQVVVRAARYAPLTIGPFAVGEGELKVLDPATLVRLPEIGGIAGNLIDSLTGQAPNEWVPLELQRCEAGACNPVRSVGTYDGSFSFSSSDYSPLFVGSYQILARAERYAPLTIGPFAVGEGELKTLDPATLVRLPVIGSISGRLVNAVNGRPLTDLSFAQVNLDRCPDGVCWDPIGSTSLDAEGRFRFDEANMARPLVVGEYQISFHADQFQSGSAGPFAVAEAQDYSLGDVPVQPTPLQFYDQQGCPDIPAGGGLCRFSVRMANGRDEMVRLKVWSTIQTWGAQSSIFQPDLPRTVRLRPGEERVVSFAMYVPRAVPAYTNFCGHVYVADDVQGFYFQPLASSHLFCSQKGADGVVRLLPKDQAADLLGRLRGLPAAQRSRR